MPGDVYGKDNNHVCIMYPIGYMFIFLMLKCSGKTCIRF